jgi:hypothetical protein
MDGTFPPWNFNVCMLLTSSSPIYDLSLRPASDSEDGAVEGHMQRRPKRASVNDARFAAVIAVLRHIFGPEVNVVRALLLWQAVRL